MHDLNCGRSRKCSYQNTAPNRYFNASRQVLLPSPFSLILAAVSLSISATSATAQSITSLAKEDNPDFRAPAMRYRLVQEQLEPSYITVLGGGGNIERLFFEANVAPHFGAGWPKLALVLTSKIVLRMRNDSTHSAPIRTPSYMPRITLYWWGPFRGTSTRSDFLSFTISHHSNGQAGPFYVTNTTTPNTFDGSFSTNFLELDYHRVFQLGDNHGVGWLKAGVRVHVPVNEDAELRSSTGDNQYGRYRLLLSTLSRRPLPLLPRIPVVLQFDYFYILDGRFQGHRFFSADRLGASGTFNVALRTEALLGFFVNGYVGQDYYNIWYKQRLKVLRVGFSVQSITSFRSPE